jgi:hypothetical protein
MYGDGRLARHRGGDLQCASAPWSVGLAPEDIAAAVAFLVEPDAGFVTA